MTEPLADVPTRKSDLEAAAWLFEQLSVEAGESADRLHIRRALDESASVWPFGQEDHWWKWLVEAGRSLGLACKIIDCTFDQLSELSQGGTRVITRVGEQRRWTGVMSKRGGNFLLLQPLRDRNRWLLKPRKLRNQLDVSGRDDLLRCLVIEPRSSHVDLTPQESDKRSPFRRLWALLRPEWQDIWIIFVFALVTGLLALATPLAVETLVNTVAFGRLLQPIVIVALMLLAFLSFSAALKALQTFVVEIIQRRLFARVAADLAFRLPRVEVEAFDGADRRELVNRFFDVVTVQKVSAQLLLDGISLVLGALIGMAVLAFYHPWLLGFDVVLLALIAFVIGVLGRGAVYTSIKESKTKYEMAAWLENVVSCPVAFRYAGAADFALDRADRLIYDYLTARKIHFRVLMRQIVFALGLQAVASTMLLGLGGWLVVSGQLTLGQLVAAELIVTVIVGSFAKLGKHMESYYDLLASVDKLGGLFDLPIEQQSGLLQIPSLGAAQVDVIGVCYDDDSGRSTLDGVNLRVERGARLLLFGDTGGRTSLLFDLLFGTRRPASGHVAVDSVDPADLRPDVLRRHVVLVRDVEIFAGTIAENVHLERTDVSTNDVRAALEQVGLFEDIQQLPDGLHTHLVDRGFPFSMNEARKLMLARAIAGRPSLLLVDGLLDSMSDDDAARLSEILADPRQPWTLIMTTGRRSIAESGTSVYRLGEESVIAVEEA